MRDPVDTRAGASGHSAEGGCCMIVRQLSSNTGLNEESFVTYLDSRFYTRTYFFDFDDLPQCYSS